MTLEYEHSGKTKEITVTPVENTYANVDVYKRQVVGRGMRRTRGTAGRIFSALAHAVSYTHLDAYGILF